MSGTTDGLLCLVHVRRSTPLDDWGSNHTQKVEAMVERINVRDAFTFLCGTLNLLESSLSPGQYKRLAEQQREHEKSYTQAFKCRACVSTQASGGKTKSRKIPIHGCAEGELYQASRCLFEIAHLELLPVACLGT